MKPFRTAALAAICLYAEPVTVTVPTRDGVLLATDVYGAEAGQPKPVLLSRTPYNKAGSATIAAGYVRHGYVVVIQDCRGRYASGGSYTPYNDDRQDNSRICATVVVPVGKRSSIKFSFSTGAIVRAGQDFTAFSVGWQTSWLKKTSKVENKSVD